MLFSPDGRWLATGSGDGWLHIYNTKVGGIILSLVFFHADPHQLKEKQWSWFVGSAKPGVFEIDWQMRGSINRIALALECREVAVIDVARIDALNPDAVCDATGRWIVPQAKMSVTAVG